MSEPTPPGKKKFKLNKKTVLIGGAGILVAGGIWWWYRKHHPATTPAATGVGTNQNQNPNYSGYGTWGQWWRRRGSGTGTTGGTVKKTNAEWAQTAETFLVSVGYNRLVAVVAIGNYLNGKGLTQDQYGIVQAAIAFEGYPPHMPPQPHIINGGGGTGQGGGGGGDKSVVNG